eukprot:TRINITY_DN6024_c0_g1_i2.p1 TRINITY_DN6024_c0_g1~~TRINITY_DN6024_c0_g1_i2.p1  ORF type:complete len:536 (-),score=81.88 TRINITY_DN6024_c0_g1_i2:660-2267(-)
MSRVFRSNALCKAPHVVAAFIAIVASVCCDIIANQSLSLAFDSPPPNLLRTDPDYFFWSNLTSLPIPNSCAKHCSARKPPVFTLPAETPCQENLQCTYDEYVLTFYRIQRLIVANHETKGRCLDPHTLECPLPSIDQCQYQCWSEWDVQVKVGGKILSQHYYNLVMLPQRPFQITSILRNPAEPAFVRVIAYYLPNLPRPDACNQIYCIWYHPSFGFEHLPGRIGDVSLTYCPKPSFNPEGSVLRLTYDNIIVSRPYQYKLEDLRRDLPKVELSICAIVKKEGKNMPVWMEYHRMMGVQRFILYDNNPDNEPDTEMEEYIASHEDFVLMKWPYHHSQTEALTDCIIRFGKSTHWLSLIDVDEFLVPVGKSKESTILKILKDNYKDSKYLHSDWVTFGPCGSLRDAKNKLVMEACTNITKSSSHSPKSTIQPRVVASMQGYGPHYVRLKQDIGIRPRSESKYTNTHFRVYHYRYRTWEEYVDRRRGGAAGRVIQWDDQRLRDQWNIGIEHSKPLPHWQNHILKRVPELKRRLKSTQ